MAYTLHVRNVNQALHAALRLVYDESSEWRHIAPRGQPTLEWKGTFITEYQCPQERVLFSPLRDANPFFHFFESLWILAGRRDTAFLEQFNPRMREYSDDGVNFYGAYGHRLRNAFVRDQIIEAIKLLRADHDTRQVVLSIWDPSTDLGMRSRDIPCNDLLMLKIRDGRLNLTVSCRSNDILWGAYGANAVQFSMIQEYIACAVGVPVGTYTQVSDSFHFYIESELYLRLINGMPSAYDAYTEPGGTVRPFRLFDSGVDTFEAWERALQNISNFIDTRITFFNLVVDPLWQAWRSYRINDLNAAIELATTCAATDWRKAAVEWLQRRLEKRNAGR